MMKKPVIDIGECVKCDICVDLCPSVFIMNDSGYIEITESETECPEEDIEEAIRNCRGDCIEWDEET